ncbi:MAG: zf-HC2 domain-containing protein [Deltaproteobacteria bacterium]|nr:zf-HC2 domain-containing protein [Deltaproteobacteria bacterium]
MDCRDVDKFVHAYLDGEFVEDDRVAFAAHVESCAHCRRIVRFEQGFKQRLRDCDLRERAPTRLQARIQSALDQEPAPVVVVSWWRRPAWVAVPAGMAAAAVLVVTLVSPQDSSVVAEQSVRWHRSGLPMDVQGKQDDEIRRFFRDKVPFAVKLPRFHDPSAKLVGARLTNLREHQAVCLTYLVKGQRVSVFVVDPQALSDVHDQRNVTWRGVRGYNVGMFVSGGTGYAVTSEMDRKNLVRLISH